METSPDLSKVERAALAAGHLANKNAIGKALQRAFLRHVSFQWVRMVLAPRLLTSGLEKVRALAPERGVLLVSNHRSFFDQYAILCAMLHRHVRWVEHMSFPVRANFFYDHPAGLFINMAVAGGAMYPPVFRDADRRALNDQAIDHITEILQHRGHVVGMHPEGTRGKGPDPYQLLPAQPGVGKMALAAKPMVLPIFINGLGNDFLADVRLGWQADGRRRQPVIAVFGDPIDYSAFLAEKPRPTLYKRCADFFMEEIRKLSTTEKQLRAACLAGDIDDDDPRWLSTHVDAPAD